MRRMESSDKAMRKAPAGSSFWRSARRADVSITNQAVLRSVFQNFVFRAGVEQGQLGDSARKFLHSLHFIIDATPAFTAAEFGSNGVQDCVSQGGSLEFR